MQDATAILNALPVPQSLKADAWDAFAQSKDENELTQRLQSLNIPKEAKAQLWDLKHSSAADPNAAIKAAQAAKFPTKAEGGNPDLPWYAGYFGPTAFQEAKDRAKKLGSVLLDTAPGAVTGMDSPEVRLLAMAQPANAFGSIPTAIETAIAPTAKLESTAEQLLHSPAVETVRAIPGAARVVANKVASSDAIAARAAANRAPLPEYTPADVARDALVTGVAGAAGGPPAAAAIEGANLLRRTDLYRGSKATLQEKLAQWMAKGDAAPAVADLPQFEGRPIAPNPSPLPVKTALTPTENVPPINTERAPLPGETAEKLNVPRPGTPGFIQQQLQAARAAETPEQLFERMKTIRDADIPSEPSSASTEPKTQYRPPPDTGLPSITPASDAPTINRAMNISEKQVARGANPGQRVLSENLLAETPEATKANVDAALKDSGEKLNAALKTATAKGATIDAQEYVQESLSDATKRIGAPKDIIFQNQINGVLDDILKRYPNIDKLTPEEAHALKVELGDAIHWSGTAYDTPVNKAMVRIYGNLNSDLKDIEGVAAEQSRWGDLYNASKGLSKTLNRKLVGRGSWLQP